MRALLAQEGGGGQVKPRARYHATSGPYSNRTLEAALQPGGHLAALVGRPVRVAGAAHRDKARGTLTREAGVVFRGASLSFSAFACAALGVARCSGPSAVEVQRPGGAWVRGSALKAEASRKRPRNAEDDPGGQPQRKRKRSAPAPAPAAVDYVEAGGWEARYVPHVAGLTPRAFQVHTHARASNRRALAGVVNRDVLLRGATELHLCAGGQHILTLRRVADGNLGLVAAVALAPGSEVSRFLGPRRPRPRRGTPLHGYAMELGFVYDTSDTTPSVVDEHLVVAPGPTDCFMAAHFINASDWPRGEPGARRANVQMEDDGTVRVLSPGVAAGEELLFDYGKAYYHHVAAAAE